MKRTKTTPTQRLIDAVLNDETLFAKAIRYRNTVTEPTWVGFVKTNGLTRLPDKTNFIHPVLDFPRLEQFILNLPITRCFVCGEIADHIHGDEKSFRLMQQHDDGKHGGCHRASECRRETINE